MSRNFNHVLYIDHVHLSGNLVLHILGSRTKYSAGEIVETTYMSDDIYVTETQWISLFWPPSEIIFYPAFADLISQNILFNHDMIGRPIPPKRYEYMYLSQNTKSYKFYI